MLAIRRCGLGLVAGPPAGDPDAMAFFARASITDPTQKSAVTAMVRSLKSAGLWTSFYALYPFVGGNATAHAQNLRSASYAITWTNAPTHNANGITGNGTTQYGTCTGLTGNSVVPHLSGQTLYVRAGAASGGTIRRMCGFADAGGTILYTIDFSDFGGGSTFNRGCAGAVAGYSNDSSGTAARTGVLSVNRTSTTSMKGYDDGSEYLSYVTSDSSTPASVDAMVLAMSMGGTANAFSSANLGAGGEPHDDHRGIPGRAGEGCRMNYFCIESADVAGFVAVVGPHEEIRPVLATLGGAFGGKYILQANIGDAGAAYAQQVALDKYKFARVLRDDGFEHTSTITGVAAVGNKLTAGSGDAWQWTRCDAVGGKCEVIAGETAQQYLLTPEDEGFTIRCEIQPVGGGALKPSEPTQLVTF
jgi:hypothetical protein